MYVRIYKLTITTDATSFHPLPWFEGHIQRDPFWQDYSNYRWHFAVGWLRGAVDFTWDKAYHGPMICFS